MRSPTDRLRRIAEWTARASVVLLAAWLASQAWVGRAAQGTESGGSAQLNRLLPQWTTDPQVAAAHIDAERPPGPIERAWLRALVAAGVNVSWAGDPSPVAVTAAPVRDPVGGSSLMIVGVGGARIGIADGAGPIDSVAGTDGAAALSLRAPLAPVAVTAGGVVATAREHGRAAPRPVLVLGRASWETRFTIAALEERGWRVVSRTPVAPGVETSQGSVHPLDTSRFSAVVVIDSTGGAFARQVAAYVRTGGGLVLAGESARLAAFTPIAPGRPGERVAPPMVFDARDARLELLGYHPITALADDAVPLREDRGRTSVAVRRVQLGRVAQVGYDESWRVRMAGGDAGIAEHGEWWNRLVATVAYAPVLSPPAAQPLADPAPRAALFEALGPPSAAPTSALRASRDWRHPGLLVLLMTILLLEIVSRRARGAT